MQIHSLRQTVFLALIASFLSLPALSQESPRPRDLGIEIGVMRPGPLNAITDVPGVLVGQVNVHDIKKGAMTGVTAVVPYKGNIFQNKIPAGVFLGNAFGKMAGYPQIRELGNIETPIVLTNTLNVAAGLDGIIDFTLSFPENSSVRSVNGVVGETNDGGINDIRARFVTKEDVLKAITEAKDGPVEEGCVGAGSGTKAFGFKAGIGTSSRKLPASLGGYTVGVLVQSNFGGELQISGVPVGKILGGYPLQKHLEHADGSIMMIVATDAPMDSRNLERLAKRAFMGMAKSGGVASNGSGDFAIAFSTAESVRIPHNAKTMELQPTAVIRNDDMTAFFMAAIEATEEAVINSLFAAKDTVTYKGQTYKALPKEQVLQILREHKALKEGA